MIEGTFLLWILIIAVFARVEEKINIEIRQFWRDEHFKVFGDYLDAVEVIREQEKQIAHLRGKTDEH